MDLNAQRFCLPYLNAQMVKLFVIEDNVAQMANYVAQMSQLLAIQDNQPTIPDNQSMLNSNGAGAVSKLITARCNVDVTARCNDDITKMDGVTPLLNLLSLFAHCPSHQIPLCFSRMSMMGNRILFVQHMSKLSCVQQTPT